jgi:hypothetical protein
LSRNFRRLAAGALAAAAALGAFAMPASADDRRDRDHRDRRGPSVGITGVQANSPGRDDHSNRSLNGETIRLTNSGRESVNLRGWTLRNDERGTFRFGDVRLPARSSVTVHTGVGRDGRGHVYMDRRNYMWDNHSDTAVLRDFRGRTVDIERWGRGGRR